MQFKKVKKEIINCKKRDFAQTCRFSAKNRVFLQKERNVVQKSTWMHKFGQLLNFFCHFCHLMLCFKRKFPKKASKLSLNLCFTADLHHLQDHFSNFLLNCSSLAKKEKREI